ncbi:putative membrane protein [Mycobacteroides abscessus]|nr:putative membrane protein [Mycobacteroides abscessus]
MAMLVLVITGTAVLLLVPGVGGAQEMGESGNPLVEALGTATVAKVVNYIGLSGLIASFFSIVYRLQPADLRVVRAGYLPTGLSGHQRSQGACAALIVPGIVGFLLSLHR